MWSQTFGFQNFPSISLYCKRIMPGTQWRLKNLAAYVVSAYVVSCCAVGNSGRRGGGWQQERIFIHWAFGCCFGSAREEERCRQPWSHFCKPFHRHHWSLTCSLLPPPLLTSAILYVALPKKGEKTQFHTVFYLAKLLL